MGATLNSIVNVSILLQNAAVQQKGFGRGLILGSSNRMGSDLYRIYTSAASLLSDGFLSSDPEYKAALKYFAQSPAPTDVMVGYSPLVSPVAQVDTVQIATVTNLTVYTVTINDVVFSYTSDGTATSTEIRDGLIAAITAGSQPVTAAAGDASHFTVTATVAGHGFGITVGARLVDVHTTTNRVGGIPAGLDAIINAGGKDWYGLMTVATRDKQDILDAAAWVEAQAYDYIYIAVTDDADVLTSSTTDVLSDLKALNYLRTAGFWSDDQQHFPEAAWFGLQLPTTPGSSNYAYKTLVGILPTATTVLTDNALSHVIFKNGNYYLTVAGVSITQSGIMAGGQWIDVVVGRDWIQANIQQAVFSVLVNTPKVDFTDAGIISLANAVNGVLQTAINNGILASYVLTPPLASSFSPAQRQSRVLPNLNWTAVLKGAIDTVNITGVITS